MIEDSGGNPVTECNTTRCRGFEFLEVEQDIIELKFSIPIIHLYSVIGIDIQYNSVANVVVKFFDENQTEKSLDKIDSKFHKQIGYRANMDECYFNWQTPTYQALQMSFWVSHHSDNELKFRFNPNIPASLFAIREIRLWVNCAVNCKTCLSDTVCGTCLEGFKTSTVQAPSGTEKCEVTFNCGANCAQCYIEGLTRICTRCEPDSHLTFSGDQNACEKNVRLGSELCIYDEYIDDQGGCSKYATDAIYEDISRLYWYPLLTTNGYYKCPLDHLIIIYDHFNCDLFFCRPKVKGCLGYSFDDLTCNMCLPSYILSEANRSECLPCESQSFCSNCQRGTYSTCTACSDGYVWKVELNMCVLPCLAEEYYNIGMNLCQTCPQGAQINALRTGCECPQWQVFNGDTCVCDVLRSFDSNHECQCVVGTVANQAGQCECPTNSQYDSTNLTCVQNQTVTKAVLKDQITSSGYVLDLEFSNELKTYAGFENKSVLSVIVDQGKQTQFTFEVTEVLGKKISVTLTPMVTFKGKRATLSLIDSTFISMNSIENRTFENDLKSFVYLSEGEKQANSATSTFAEVTVISIICTIIPIAIFSNFYVLINTIDLTGFLYYLLFIDVRYPENVLTFFGFFQNFQFPFIPSMFESFLDSDYVQEAPQKFIDNGFQPYFLSNSGQSVTIVSFIIGMYVVGKIFSYVRIPKLQPYLKRAMDETWEFSAFFDLLWSLYIYFLIGSLLQFTVYDSGEVNYVLNYILHSLFAVIHLGCPFVITYFLVQKKNMKSDVVFKKIFTTLIGGIQLFDEDNRPLPQELVNQSIDQEKYNLESQNQTQQIPSSIETSAKNCDVQLIEQQKQSRRQYYQMKTSKLYNGILYLRKLGFALVIVFMTSSPYTQLGLITALNIGIAGYIFYIMPLESKSENIKNGIGELVLILIQICVCFLVPDDIESSEEDRIRIGWLIVGLSAFILSWHGVQMLYEMIKSIFDSIKSLICKKKVEPSQSSQSVSETAKVNPMHAKEGMNQELQQSFDESESPEKSLEVTERIQEPQLQLNQSDNQNTETIILRKRRGLFSQHGRRIQMQQSERQPLQITHIKPFQKQQIELPNQLS